MPYIDQSKRSVFANEIMNLGTKFEAYGVTPGDLNYLISKICKEYIDCKGENYTHYNDIVGVLENAKLEVYRRLISVYEDKKITENGDIY